MKKNGFPDRLKALMEQKKLTLAQVAQAINTSPPSVHRWTKGGEIEYDNLLALATFLEVNWIWLRYGDEAIRTASTAVPESETESDLRREYLDRIMLNEARMKTALEMAQIINWEWNALTGTFTFSDNAESVFGRRPDTIRERFAPFASLPLEELIELFTSQNGYLWDFKTEAPDSGEQWFASRAKLVLDPQNIPLRVIGVTADITERKKAEFALERSEYMMRKIIETIPVGLWGADENGVINLANPEVIRIWGGAKYVGLENYGLYKGTWEKSGQALTKDDWTLARAVKTGEISEAEVVNIEAFDGVPRSIIMYATPLINPEGKIIGAIEVNQDITDLKQTERRLRRSHEQLQRLYQQNSFGVVAFNEAGIQRVNDRFASLSGIKHPQIKDLPLTTIFDHETASKILEINELGDARRIEGRLLINGSDETQHRKVDIQVIGSTASDIDVSMLLVFT
ncbi:PAS domain S-box-containing protein [Methylophilus rhizosphaerae]|uniref:histidine kinase n=1 Tax=Methylophilus rhizosphaerae TaxID=492660 RepID=A0A1G9D8E0_9PROT|nr:PAS domain S-box protein [Methylophilus rhizosphaerae]SDK59984.1 PAS domain S-box-containing protein [Methylophilus rhizosphaerae]